MDNQPTQSTPPLPISTNPPKTFLLILGAIALMAVSAVGGYLVYQKQILLPSDAKPKMREGPQTIVSYSPTPTEANSTLNGSDKTANWETFMDKNFTVSYPSEIVTVKNYSLGEFDQKIKRDSPKAFSSIRNLEPPKVLSAVILYSSDYYGSCASETENECRRFMTIWIFDNPQKLNISDWYETYGYYPWSISGINSESEAPHGELVIDKQEGKITGGVLNSTKKILIPKQGKMVFIYAELSDSDAVNFNRNIDDKDLIYQILSTFKFTQ